MEIAYNENIFPLKGILSDSMSDKEFYVFCQENELFHIERDENKQIIIMPPTGSLSDRHNVKIITQLENWSEKNKTGIAFGSSGGFTLPDNSVFSPDAAWMKIEKWKKISKEDQQKFAHVCPDFVIELKSPSDIIKYLKNKMNKWIENGCALAWLINPENEMIFIYREDGTIDKVTGFDKTLSGEKVLPGFQLDLSILEN